MAKAKRGPIDYIRKRSDSKLLWFRYQFPKLMGWRAYEKPLGTPDMKTARERAAPHLIRCVAWVQEYKGKLGPGAERRQVATLDWRYPPDLKGPLRLPDGRTVQIKNGMCVYVAEDGEILEIVPNLVRVPVEGAFWTAAEYQGAVDSGELGDGQLWEHDCPEWRGEAIELPPGVIRPDQCRAPADGGLIEAKAPPRTKPRPGADELLMHVERWAAEGHKPKPTVREAIRAVQIFREMSEGKPLKECGRADGIELREHLFKQKMASGTVQKKLGLLSAALTYSKMHYDYDGPNPFAGLVTKAIKLRKRDAVKGVAFTEEDMAKVRAALPTWDDPECTLLWVLCATTGMRRGEAFLIEREERIGAGRGLRCITIIPTDEDDTIKNEDSVRTIPIPDDAVPYLPAEISGRLFQGTAKNVGKRLMAKLIKIGITGRGKTLKSTRHRAAKLLHNTKVDGQYCPDKLRYEVLGHERGERKVADVVYAGLYRPEELKPWIDVIGLGPTDRIS